MTNTAPSPAPLLLVQYDVETPSEQIFTRIYTTAPATLEDIALDVLDAIDGSPTYTVRGEEVDSNLAASALLSGGEVRRDYHDGDDLVIFNLRIDEIQPDEATVLRRFHIA